MFRFAGSVVLRGGRGAAGRYHWRVRGGPAVSGHTGFAPLTGVCFPRLHCSGSRLLYREQALRCMRFQFSGTPQKRGLGWACVLCLPRPSSSGRQEPDRCTLPGAVHSPQCGAPSPLRGPSLSFRARAGWVRLVSVLGSWPLAAQNLRKSLVRNWEPVCSLVGAAISGAEFAPFSFPLPPASGVGWAGQQPASSSLELLSPSFVLQTVPQCVQAC